MYTVSGSGSMLYHVLFYVIYVYSQRVWVHVVSCSVLGNLCIQSAGLGPCCIIFCSR